MHPVCCHVNNHCHWKLRRCADIPPLNQHLPLLKWKHRAPPGQTWPCIRRKWAVTINVCGKQVSDSPSSIYRREDTRALLDRLSACFPAHGSESDMKHETQIEHTVFEIITGCLLCILCEYIELLRGQGPVMRILAARLDARSIRFVKVSALELTYALRTRHEIMFIAWWRRFWHVQLRSL